MYSSGAGLCTVGDALDVTTAFMRIIAWTSKPLATFSLFITDHFNGEFVSVWQSFEQWFSIDIESIF